MSKPAERPRLFDRLKASLGEGIRFARGEQALIVTEVSTVTPEQITGLRKQLKLTPGGLAEALKVEPAVVERLEAGDILAEGPVLRLLEIFLKAPELAAAVADKSKRVQKRMGEPRETKPATRPPKPRAKIKPKATPAE
jgi:DNA-binding transcriptional regulator YiaG